MDIVIPAPTPFNMRVFKILIPITRGGKIFPPYLLRYGYYLRISVGAGFFDIPIRNELALWLAKYIPISLPNGSHIIKSRALRLVMFFNALLVSIMLYKQKSSRPLSNCTLKIKE